MEPVRYPVRTPTWVVAIVALATIASVAIAVWLPGYLAAPAGEAWVVWLLDGAVCLLPVLALAASRAYWIRRGAIELHADRIVVPGAFRGSHTFALAGIRIERLRVVQQIRPLGLPTGPQLDRGEFVTLSDGGHRRKLSERVLVAPGTLVALLADLDALARGEPARGPAGWAKVLDTVAEMFEAQRAADPDEARLDAELRNFD